MRRDVCKRMNNVSFERVDGGRGQRDVGVSAGAVLIDDGDGDGINAG